MEKLYDLQEAVEVVGFIHKLILNQRYHLTETALASKANAFLQELSKDLYTKAKLAKTEALNEQAD
jgi:hypothetical protein